MSHSNFRCLRRSSLAFNWLRVNFFFFLRGSGVDVPVAASFPLAAGVAALEAAGVMAGLALREASLDGGFALASRKASSTIAAFPWWVRRPASTFQISGPVPQGWKVIRGSKETGSQSALTNSMLCEMMHTAPPHSRIATATPPTASRSRKFVTSSKTTTFGED